MLQLHVFPDTEQKTAASEGELAL